MLAESGYGFAALALIAVVLVGSGAMAVRASKREEHNNG